MSLPVPPAALPPNPPRHELGPPLRLVRFYRPKHGGWDARRSWGPLANTRFDHHRPPPGSDRASEVWYAASSLVGAVAEGFGSLGFVDRHSGRRLVVARVERPLAVLDLVGVAARAFALDQRIATTTAFETTQQWARAFHRSYPQLLGLRWRGRQSGSICVVLTEHAEMSCLAPEADHDVGDPAVWPRIVQAAQRAHLRTVLSSPYPVPKEKEP